MKVLLDECLPKRLKQAFQRHTVSTVPEMGWAGKMNGELLKLAKGKFLEDSNMAVVLLVIRNNRYETFKPLISKVQQALETISTGRLVRIESEE